MHPDQQFDDDPFEEINPYESPKGELVEAPKKQFEISGEPSVKFNGTWWRPKWVIEDDVECVYRLNGFGEIRIFVAAGFETDFASVPRWLWGFYPSQSVYNRLTIIHDRLCESSCDRSLADEFFRVGLQSDPFNAPWYVWWPMYRAVRSYGLFSGRWRALWRIFKSKGSKDDREQDREEGGA